MALERLAIENVRCIETADLEFDARCNLICGPNASGKTSLLEAIYFLGRARSFRASRNDTLIGRGATALTTTGRLTQGQRRHVLGLSYRPDGLEGRLDGRPVTGIAELATIFPVQAIDPELHQLIEEGPQHRRRYLDWGVFHVEPRFVDIWQRFQRALRQRNAALRGHAAAEIVRIWDADVIDAGSQVAEARSRYLEGLRPQVKAMGEHLLGEPIELHLAQGWAAERSLREALDRSWSQDSERGTTHAGPHRADLQVRLKGETARARVSRGQQKLIAAAMLLGQLRCDAEYGSTTAALLIDDPAAELDAGSLDRLLQEILALPLQLFVTALDGETPSLKSLDTAKRFHVEQGVLTPV